MLVCNRRHYFVQHCSVTINATWRVLWTVDLPALSSEVRSALAQLTSPSGVNYTLVDVDTTGPLLRQRTALVIFMDKAVKRTNISSLLDAVHASLTALSSGTLLSYIASQPALFSGLELIRPLNFRRLTFGVVLDTVVAFLENLELKIITERGEKGFEKSGLELEGR